MSATVGRWRRTSVADPQTAIAHSLLDASDAAPLAVRLAGLAERAPFDLNGPSTRELFTWRRHRSWRVVAVRGGHGAASAGTARRTAAATESRPPVGCSAAGCNRRHRLPGRRRGLPHRPAPYPSAPGRRCMPPPPARTRRAATARATHPGRRRDRRAATRPATAPTATASSPAEETCPAGTTRTREQHPQQPHDVDRGRAPAVPMAAAAPRPSSGPRAPPVRR